ncbi:hypothetical protein [Roseovarius amoyensis]|uniref:hypothetical protein n=1 Tax=Roseovarius amoyensis TaxID=2211448 RepID=UPI0019551480|nr:hypothetical protein [Roseovarius amoyensis]
MDITVGMSPWNALSPQMQKFVEIETKSYSVHHYAEIHKADHDAWKKFEADGTEATRLSQDHVELITEVAMPSGNSIISDRVRGQVGFGEMLRGLSLKDWTDPAIRWGEISLNEWEVPL